MKTVGTLNQARAVLSGLKTLGHYIKIQEILKGDQDLTGKWRYAIYLEVHTPGEMIYQIVMMIEDKRNIPNDLWPDLININ